MKIGGGGKVSRRRYISTNISLDPKVNKLAMQYGDFAALLYTWMIPHAEDTGRITGDPEELLFLVAPGRRDKTEEDVAAAIEGMAQLGLVHRSEINGKLMLQFPDSFYRYQTYIPANKRDQKTKSTQHDDIQDDINEENSSAFCAEISEKNYFSPEPAKNSVSPSPSPSPSLSPSFSVSRDILPPAEQPAASDPVPYQEIAAKYNEICVSLPKVRSLTKERKKHIKARWKEHPDIEFFCAVFRKAEESSFLSGRDGKWTSCNFDWLMNAANMTKVIEGTYDNRVVPIGNTGQRAGPPMNEPKGFAGIREFMERVREKGGHWE